MKNNDRYNSMNRPRVVIIGQEAAPDRRRVDSAELFGSQNEIIIEHQNDEYRLRITSNGKLILTK